MRQSHQPRTTTTTTNKGLSSLQKAALRLVRCEELSRAAKLLTSPGLAPLSEAVAAKLAKKHPPRVDDIGRILGVDSFSSIDLSRSTFFETVLSLPRGSGPGPSGWRYEHLKILAESGATADGLFSVCSLIAKGIIPECIASRLIAIPKSNGDVRPIAIGESLRRLTAKAICNQKKESFGQFFSPLQHGVAVQGGSDLLVHHLQLLLASNPSWVMVKTDIENAFNSLDRIRLLEETAKSFPDLYEHVFSLYSLKNPLLF